MEEIMNKNSLQLIFSSFVILIAIAACVLPGQAVPPAPEAPGIDPNTVASAVAGTAQASAQQTQQANPLPATATPAPVDTLPAEPPATGKLKEEQADGTTLFTDHDGGYQVTFPQGWVVIIPEKDDLNQIFNSMPEQEQNVAQMIETAKRADVNNMIAVFSFNFKAQQGGYTPNINISYDTNPSLAATSLKDVLDSTAAYYPSMGITVIRSELKNTASGLETGLIETEWALNAANGQKVSLHQKQIIFKSGSGIVVITFSTIRDATVDLTPDFDKLIESLQLLD
jgi:hypothetical protein